MWNVILTKFDMFIQDLIYLLFMGRGIKNVSYTFVILQTTNSNTLEYQQKQTTKLCTLNYVPAKSNTLKVF